MKFNLKSKIIVGVGDTSLLVYKYFHVELK